MSGRLEKSEITYVEIEWIQGLFGYKPFDMNSDIIGSF